MTVAVRAVAYVAIVVGLIVVHELGHYTAGLIAGVPPRLMKVVLVRYPFHVALRDRDAWRSPAEGAAYAGLLQRLIPRSEALLLFASGGLILQAIGATAFVAAFSALGDGGLAFFAATYSAGLVAAYLAVELVGSFVPRMPAGDVRGMLSVSVAGGSAILVLLVAAHAGLVLWVL